MTKATSALDAESETLVNSALATLLRENNTTISIAHRLSTIKRSDQIVVLSTDGTVAEQGTYNELAAKPEGAFTRLMEWQMSGGEPTEGAAAGPKGAAVSVHRGPPTEVEEEIEGLHEEDEGEGDVEEQEGVKVRKEAAAARQQ